MYSRRLVDRRFFINYGFSMQRQAVAFRVRDVSQEQRTQSPPCSSCFSQWSLLWLRKSEAIANRRGGKAAVAEKANLIPSSSSPLPLSRVARAGGVVASLSLSANSAFCPLPIFSPFSCRFCGLTNITGATPLARATARRRRAKRRR